MKNLKLLTFTIFFALCGVSVHAQTMEAPFQLSLTPDIAVHSDNTIINGVALNVWGQNPQRALNIGFINGSTGHSSGVSLGLANYAENYSGAQLAWFANYASGRFSGLQWSIFNYAETLKGVQLGWVNFADNVEKGLQVGLLNIMRNNIYWFGALPNEVAPMMVLVNWHY